MHMGIRKKFIIIILVLLILSNLLIGIVAYNISKTQLEENGRWMLRNTVQMAVELADALNDEVEEGNITMQEAQQKVKVALLGELNEDGTRPINEDIDLGKLGYLFIYNEEGVAVAHPTHEGQNLWVDRPSSEILPIGDQIERELSGGGFTSYDWQLPYDDEQSTKITYAQYYPEWEWVIVAGSYMEDFNKGANNILYGLIIVLIVFTIIGFITVYFISGKISYGIIRAAEYADRLTHNKLDTADLNYNNSDEVGILISTLNSMKNRLMSSYQELEAYNEEVNSINIEMEDVNKRLLKSNYRYSALYNNMTAGFAYHKTIFDEKGNPINYQYVEVNEEFARLTGMEKEGIIGKMVTELFPGIKNSETDWIRIYGQLSKAEEQKRLKEFFEPLGRWFDISAFSFQEGYFAVIFSDITELMLYQEELKNQKTELMENYERLEADNEEILALNEELEESYNEVNKLNQNMEQMIHLTSRLNIENLGEDEFLNDLFDTSFDLIPEAEYGLLFDYQWDRIRILNAIGLDIEPDTELKCKSNINKIMERESILLDSMDARNLINRSKLSESQEEVFNNLKETVILNITTHQEEKIGIALCISRDSRETFSTSSSMILKAFRELSSVFYRLHQHSLIQNKMRTDILIAVVRMLAIHDSYTKNHSEKVAQISREIAEEMGLDDKLIERTYLTGLVHDIGKVLIPFDILNKEGELSEEEFSLIKKHPIWGFKTLKDFEGLQDVANYILSHHERWDGEGYPRGLKEEEIPLISQIITVADAWDAMTSERSYRKALSRSEALKELVDCKGNHFSPAVVEAFFRIQKY